MALIRTSTPYPLPPTHYPLLPTPYPLPPTPYPLPPTPYPLPPTPYPLPPTPNPQPPTPNPPTPQPPNPNLTLTLTLTLGFCEIGKMMPAIFQTDNRTTSAHSLEARYWHISAYILANGEITINSASNAPSCDTN